MNFYSHETYGERVAGVHLVPGGCFLMEVFVPDLTRFTLGQVNMARRVTTERWNNWKREPFTSESGKHISIYEL